MNSRAATTFYSSRRFTVAKPSNRVSPTLPSTANVTPGVYGRGGQYQTLAATLQATVSIFSSTRYPKYPYDRLWT
jgi:hypothetical protein